MLIPACQSGGDDAPQQIEAPAAALSQAQPSAQQAKLLGSDSIDFDTFGFSVALSGDTAVVGANRNDERGTDAGAAYVFVRSAASWTQQAKLTAADGATNENFGVSVAVSGDTALVGAIFDSDPGGSDLGAAYVFVRSGATWTQQAKLEPPDGISDDQFGTWLALSGDTAVIGAVHHFVAGVRTGAAYVFVRSGATWSLQAELTVADGAADDQLGTSVALAGDTAVIGAVNAGPAHAGAAYVFVRSGTTWTEQAQLTTADGAALDHFGASIAVSGDTAVVGASGNDAVGQDAGAAYVFVRSGTTWAQQARLTATDAAGSDAFGAAIALGGDTALVGSRFNNERGASAGAAYVFARSGASWAQQAKLTAADAAAVDFFGASVALSGDSALIGAPGRDDQGSSSGAAYLFGPAQGRNGAACTTGATCASGFCTDGVCCNTACGGGTPGDCQACSVAAGAAADGTCGPRAAGTVCRAAGGACDVAETCTGTSTACPADRLATAGTVCRAAAGMCDAAETCTGSSAACPGDRLEPAGQMCRPARGPCDLAEVCTGGAIACPANRFKPDLSLCFPGLFGLPGICFRGHCIL
ncbi:MAG TPA: hypothetical protein VHT91_48035 [Kofleriaceae bacterium]|nr:hypothetical protein [Kofleriaceae bacterium]